MPRLIGEEGMILELGLLLAIQPTEEGEEEDYQTTVAEETEETTNYSSSDSKKSRGCVSHHLVLYSVEIAFVFVSRCSNRTSIPIVVNFKSTRIRLCFLY
ncbi:MAG: hypothetical protein WAM27_01135 [Nitrososphaeraceae archaeon]